MLEHCVANLVARTEAQTKSLEDIAKGAGFGETKTVLSRRAFATDERRCILNFFFIHYMLGEGLMTAVISSIRASSDLETKFAPIVLFTRARVEYDYSGGHFENEAHITIAPDNHPLDCACGCSGVHARGVRVVGRVTHR